MARGACLAGPRPRGDAAGKEREEMENECILRVGECRARDASSSSQSFSRETDDVSKVITESQHYVTVCDSRISPSLRPL